MINLRWMRILVFYDLPVTTDELRKIYHKFHRFLIKDGYDMLQNSVYCRLCGGHDAVNKFVTKLERVVPSKGNVRVMTITEKQYASMQFLVGTATKQEKRNKEQKQLLLF
jgi:CRISPR-associated protein Cas2